MKMAGDPENIEMSDLTVNGEIIEIVDNFIYLGANTTNDCNDSKGSEDGWPLREVQSSVSATSGNTARLHYKRQSGFSIL